MLAVTGIGMVSALGRGVVDGCAASRAGLLRIAPLDEPRLFDADGGGSQAPQGHSIPWVTAGFSGLGRLTALAVAGLADLALSVEVRDLSRSALYLVAPSDIHRRILEESGLLPEECDARREVYTRRLMPAVLKNMRSRMPPAIQRTLFGDAGLFEALRDSAELLRTHQVDRCIIGALDSLVEPQVAWSLDQLGLLKGPEHPVGVLPGEAAAFAVLELPASAKRRGTSIEASINAFHFESERFHRRSRQPALGQALSRCVRTTLEALSDRGEETGLIIGALNGDAYRAQDWGTALVRLSDLPLRTTRQWYPAQSVGEIGAATGLVGLCMAIRGFARGYAQTRDVLVWTAGDDGGRGAFHVKAPERSLRKEGRT
ncbi:hypothetical protein DRW03_14885 [Corallococcus sp. H22C18031201]|nr:hypothetical protein DRW03_14885 [Corallococcus sp. H22C18031201]